MRITVFAKGLAVLGALSAASAWGQTETADALRQPGSAVADAFAYGDFLYPSTDPAENPANSPSGAAVDQPPEDPSGGGDWCAEPCCDSGCASCRPCPCCSGRDPWTLPQPLVLQRLGITAGGFIEQGISVLANQPADRFNGPVALNDRDGEYQMNQLAFYLDRTVDTGGYGWDVGGNVCLLYGTDGFFTQAAGLEDNWGQSQPYYQLALPQLYLDVAYNDLTVRMGHFFTILGYEAILAPENFFYSHAYTMVYGEPFTHTGLLAMYQMNDRWKISAGLHRGWNQFEDAGGNDSMGLLAGVNWTSRDGRKEIGLALTSSEETPADDKVVLYSLVGALHLTEKLSYVVQHDYGQSSASGAAMAEWYGLNQYFLYDVNETWSAGLRFEWFRDDAGIRVTGARPNNLLNGASFPGDFYELTLGLNWTPHPNVILRPEVRWDWYDASHDAVSPLPYDTGEKASQFLFGCDLIVTF